MDNIKKGLIVSSAFLPSIVFLEYLSKKKQFRYAPSICLNIISNKMTNTFTKIGIIIGKISSFYTLIDFTEIKQSISDLIVPIIKILKSPFYTLKGYIYYLELNKKKKTIFFGTLTLFLSSYLIFTNGQIIRNNIPLKLKQIIKNI